MSGLEISGTMAVDALTIRSQARDWVVEQRAGSDWSDGDAKNLEQWLQESPAHLIAYWRMDAAWQSAQRLAATCAPMQKPGGSGRGILRVHLARIAGMVAVIAVLSAGIFNYFREPVAKTYATPVGGQMLITLADGSQVQLNTDTVLRLSGAPNHRQAFLERGEAFFSIKHDSAHPFVLTAAGHLVTDLGTKFAVRADKDHLRVALIEGLAEIEFVNPGRKASSAMLRPGDVAVATPNSLSLTTATSARLKDELSWRQGMLTFKDTTLAEAAATLNRYNREKIVISDPKVAGLKIYGTFPTKGAAAFADVTQAYFKLRIENRKGEIVLSR